MPKVKTKSVGASQTQSQEDMDQAQTQTNIQANKAATAMGEEELESKINDLVKYMLIMDQKKLPIKRGDITKNVLKEHSRAYAVVFEKAKEKLKQVFGLEVVEFLGKPQKCYILVNLHEAPIDPPEEDEEAKAAKPTSSEADEQRTGILLVILTAIFMNNNVMADTSLYGLLKHLGVDIDVPHSTFGSLTALLKEFERKSYLEKLRLPNSDPPTYEFRWGERARHELSKRKCLQFVTKIYGMTDVTQWTSQWAEVSRDNGGAA